MKIEHSVLKRRVDYALFTRARPYVFIEAKQTGGLDTSGEQQLFKYAYGEGIPILILTDGDRWDFYLSMAAGRPSERCFLSLNLSESDARENNEQHLERVLRRVDVESGSAKRYAEDLLEARRKRDHALKTIPKAWQALVNEPDDMLIDLVAEKVHELIGDKPGGTDVAEFLHGLQSASASTKKITEVSRGKRVTHMRGRKLVGFQCDGQIVRPGTAIETLVAVVQHFARVDPQFMEQFETKTKGRKRSLVARTQTELHPDPKFSEKIARDLGNGWWLGGNLSGDSIRKRIEIAREVSDVGSRLVLIEEENADNGKSLA